MLLSNHYLKISYTLHVFSFMSIYGNQFQSGNYMIDRKHTHINTHTHTYTHTHTHFISSNLKIIMTVFLYFL